MNIYGKPGESMPQVGGTCPEGWVVMQGERPTPDYVASESGQWVLPSPTLAQVQAQRLAAYQAESDPLKIEAEYDAQATESAPDYAAWVAKVQEIKARHPLPAGE